MAWANKCLLLVIRKGDSGAVMPTKWRVVGGFAGSGYSMAAVQSHHCSNSSSCIL